MISMVMVNLIAGRRSAPTTVLAAALLAVLQVDPVFGVVSGVLAFFCGSSGHPAGG